MDAPIAPKELALLIGALVGGPITDAHRIVAVRAMLYALDSQLDHEMQDYVELLRRAQNALATEFHRVRGSLKETP